MADAFQLSNRSIASFIKEEHGRIRQVIESCWSEINQTSVNSMTSFGEKKSNSSLKLLDKSKLNDKLLIFLPIINLFKNSFCEYQLVDAELWFNNGSKVPFHNDVPLYLQSGQEVALQIWLLLDVWSQDTEKEETYFNNNGLECLLPKVLGILPAGSDKILTSKGYLAFGEFNAESRIGGNSLRTSDFLFFKNGVIHGVLNTLNKKVLRTALALRFYKNNSILSQDTNWLKWFIYNCPSELAYENSYIERLLKESPCLSKNDIDPSHLIKVDNNDYKKLIDRLTTSSI